MIDGHFRESVGSIGLAEDEELRHRITSRTSLQIWEEISPLYKKELQKKKSFELAFSVFVLCKTQYGNSYLH
jgi:hypothetical protein